MKKEDFLKVLNRRRYSYQIENDVIIVTYSGSVDLESLTTLPEGIEFKNSGYVDLQSLTTLPKGIEFKNSGSVDLESLTTLPEGIEFKNSGYVDLESLTTLPEGIEFKNSGYVDLQSLTTLPKGIEFKNSGSVDLRSLTTLPEGIEFKNSGSVDLRSLTTLPEGIEFKNGGWVYLRSLTTCKYQGKQLNLKYIDGYSMIINSTKKVDGYIIYKAQYFKGGDLKDLPKCFIAEKSNYFAHGKTMQEAISDVQFKFLQDNFNLDELVKQIKQKQTVNVNEYRLLTGACSFGVSQFMKEKNITVDELPLSEVLEITKGHYGYDKIVKVLG